MLFVEEIRKETGSNKVIPMELDVSSLASVRQFCAKVLKDETRLDILVNNAGVAGLRKTLTEDGLESQFACNHFGPFLLTNILLGMSRIICNFLINTVIILKEKLRFIISTAFFHVGLMKKTGKARVVSVSSLAHTWTKNLDLDNLNSEKKWEPKFIYARAKLCNILFMKELARRCKEAGVAGITANAVNPGGVQTATFRHARKAFKYMIMVSQFFFKVS